MCNCVEIIRKNRENVVKVAIREEIIRSFVNKVKETDVKVAEDGRVEVTYKCVIDEKITRIAFSVVDKIIELLEENK